MQFHVRAGAFADQAVGALIVPIGPNLTMGPSETEVDDRLGGALRQALEDTRFNGTVGKTLVFPTLGQLPAKRVVATGIGDSGKRSANEIRRAWGLAARAARDAGARTIASPSPWADGLSEADAYRAAVEGIRLATYRFLEYRTQDRPETDIDSVTFLGGEDAPHRGIAIGERVADSVVLARDLGNQPAHALYPARLADIAVETAERLGLKCTVYDRAALEDLGARAIITVGQGSAREPRLIHLTYRPQGEVRGTIGLVGKAITFDTGGINLKPSGAVEKMKIDMAGGAAVLGAMAALPALELPFVVHGVIAAAENMPSGTAFRPGDVITALNGKTIEIANTDAEGRLVLADALTYTARQGAEAMIDLATLTGACIVALGQEATGVFGTDQALIDEILAAARWTGEKMWHMPLWDDYRELIKGDVADVKNSGGRWGGAITAALFLQEFSEGVSWAHLDIAGPAWSDRARDLTPKGATGHAVRTLLTFLEHRARA